MKDLTSWKGWCWMEYKQYDVVIDADICIGCGECVEMCPTMAISYDAVGGAVFLKDLCGACGACTEVDCPTGALEVR